MHIEPEPWTVNGEQTIAETPFFRVRAEQCSTAEGHQLDYYLIDTSDWVNVVAVTEQLELVTVRQYRHATRTVTLEVPAGSCRPGEDPVAAGIRELREETGFTGRAVLLRRRYTNPALLGNQLCTLLCYPAAPVSVPSSEGAEQTVPVLIKAVDWLNSDWAARADHLLTALAIHDLLALVAPAPPVRVATAAQCLVTLMSADPPVIPGLA